MYSLVLRGFLIWICSLSRSQISSWGCLFETGHGKDFLNEDWCLIIIKRSMLLARVCWFVVLSSNLHIYTWLGTVSSLFVFAIRAFSFVWFCNDHTIKKSSFQFWFSLICFLFDFVQILGNRDRLLLHLIYNSLIILGFFNN